MQEACGFVLFFVFFLKGNETKTKRTKNPLENKIRRTQYEKHNTKGRQSQRAVKSKTPMEDCLLMGNGAAFFLQSCQLITPEQSATGGCKLWGETAKGSKFSLLRQSATLPSSHLLPAQARPGDIDFLVALKLVPCSSLSSHLLLVSEACKAKAATGWGFTEACLKFSFCNGAGFVFATHCKLARTQHSLSSHTLQACTHTLLSLLSCTVSLHPHAALSPLTHLAFCYLFSSNPFCL